MKENIKILEEFIKYYESEAISRKFRGTLSISVDEYDIDAIEHLLKAYKEKEKHLNFYEKNDSYKERILELEEENKEWKEKWDKDTHKLQNDLDLTNADKINNYIPVSLVKEKIEELKEKADEDNKEEYIKIQALQELLEKRE